MKLGPFACLLYNSGIIPVTVRLIIGLPAVYYYSLVFYSLHIMTLLLRLLQRTDFKIVFQEISGTVLNSILWRRFGAIIEYTRPSSE